MQENKYNPALFWFAMAVALCSLGLIAIGGLVTSHGVGMAVPDWPTSYGYNMFALPVSMWLTGGVFHEHTHRLWASCVGVLVVALTRWLGGRKSGVPLMVVGVAEIVAGQLLLLLGPEWKGGGHFLSGIGGVVLLAGIVWVRNGPAVRPLPALGWLAFWLVQFQGLLGGLRVVLDAHVFAGTNLGLVFGVFHGCLAQVFLVLLGAIALMTSRWWIVAAGFQPAVEPGFQPGGEARGTAGVVEDFKAGPGGRMPPSTAGKMPAATWLVLATTVLVFFQLLIGATMRHQHAGLAIPDFPLAYGEWWPDMSPEAVARYNAARIEVSAHNPITFFQIGLQMAHRLTAVAILVAVGLCFWRARGDLMRKLCAGWLGLVLVQAGLGMWTVWSNKAADIATLHVVFGASTLVSGALISIIAVRFNFRCCSGAQFLASDAVLTGPVWPADKNQAQSAS